MRLIELLVLFQLSSSAILAGPAVIHPDAFEGRANCDLLFPELAKCRMPVRFGYVGNGAGLWGQIAARDNLTANPEHQLLTPRLGKILRQPGYKTGANVVDIGPGNGEKAQSILDAPALQNYLAVDFSQGLLQRVSAKLTAKFPNRKISQHQVDLEKSDFRDQTRALEANGKPSVFLLLGQTLGNPENRPSFLLNIRKSMAPKDTLVVGVDLFQPAKVEALVKEYQDRAESEFATWGLKNLGMVPGKNGTVKVEFDPATNDIIGKFVFLSEHTVMMKSSGAENKSVSFKTGEEVIFFQSHRFTQDELEKDFADAGFTIVTEIDPVNHYALVTAVPR